MKKASYNTSLNVDLAKHRELFVRATVILYVRYLAHKPADFLGYLRNLVGLHLSIPFKLRSDFFCFGGIAYYFWWDLT